MGYIIKTLIIECIMILIILAEPVKCIKKISSVSMRIIYCIIIVLIAIELYPLIELFTKKTPENNDCYKEKAYEVSSLSRLSCIILDDNDNIYCFYGYDDCLAVYDKNLNLKHAYYFPYSRNGRSTVAFIDGEVMVENRLNTIYTCQ